MESAAAVIEALKKCADPIRAAAGGRYFKTGPGQYGEGDLFWGIRVPQQRLIAKGALGLPLAEVEKLLESPIHELRLTALLILVYRMRRADLEAQSDIVAFYLGHRAYVNNWDLVDTSASHLLGLYYASQPGHQQLYELARSSNLWDRRIAIIATFGFLAQGQFDETLALAEILLTDREDLIQKAVGWALREVGKRNHDLEVGFLNKHAAQMPRTMLRYALEKFSPAQRKFYLTLGANDAKLP